MLIVLWATKGGQGVSVASALAAQAAADNGPTLLVDLCGDQHAIFNAHEAEQGIGEWTTSGLSTKVLDRYQIKLGNNLSLLSATTASFQAEHSRAEELADYLDKQKATVVVDAGASNGDPNVEAYREAILARADESVFVTKKCYLSLRKSVSLTQKPTKMVVIEEPGRSLTTWDCRRAVGVQDSITLPYDPAISRSVDAGMVRTHVPKEAVRAMAPLVKAPMTTSAPQPSAQTDILNGITVSPAEASPSGGGKGRLCGHPLSDGRTCNNRVSGSGKKCSAGHIAK